jgi:hypothetical protein
MKARLGEFSLASQYSRKELAGVGVYGSIVYAPSPAMWLHLR